MRETTLYEKVANDISHLITSGTFRPGDRIPSVRRQNRQMKVSIATVTEAYHLLEDRGLIECRPQSGYYFIASPAGAGTEIELSQPTSRPTKVSVSELVMMVLKNNRDSSLVQLGAAVPNPDLLPVVRLNREIV